MQYSYLETPIGKLLVAGSDDAIELIRFPNGPKGQSGSARGEPRLEWEHVTPQPGSPLAELGRQLDAYFGRELRTFDLPLQPSGTRFQRSVWDALQKIPYGTTWSYGTLATRIGRPTAARAVGAANGRNPLPIVIPCHRVIGSSGRLTGFGGGLDTKQTLLELEAAGRDSGAPRV